MRTSGHMSHARSGRPNQHAGVLERVRAMQEALLAAGTLPPRDRSSSPPVRSRNSSRAGQPQRALERSSSVAAALPQRRLSRTVPVNRTFFWSTMPRHPQRRKGRTGARRGHHYLHWCQSLRRRRRHELHEQVLPGLAPARPRWRPRQSATHVRARPSRPWAST